MPSLLGSTGYAVISGPYGETRETDTYDCCHCCITVHVKPGSGKIRGACRMCYQPTCGEGKCRPCIPFLRKIEEDENRHRLWKVMERGADNS